MENEAIGARAYRGMTNAKIEELVRRVCRNYRVPVPRVVWRPLGRWGAEWSISDEGRTTIAFNPAKEGARHPLTVTHELAHQVHHFLADDKWEQEPHGPQFMACHISILDTCRMIPVVGMRAICDAWKVKYLDPGVSNSLDRLERIVRKA
jgi:hypothetical protein